MLRIILIGLAVVALIVVGAGLYSFKVYRARMADAEQAWSAIAAQAPNASQSLPRFDPTQLADQPEIARRYLTHAIAPGTPLNPVVSLTMQGVFRLGDADAPRELAMSARQILAAPSEFVWIPTMAGGGMRIWGSDGLHQGNGWTRFWMYGVVPLVQAADTPDLNRAALVRPAIESIWAPAALHPALGARWEQTGENTARVTPAQSDITIDLTLDATGTVTEVVAQRWSNANPDAEYRLQPFGGFVTSEGTFDGFTIPTQVAVGNHFGTADFFAFFEAQLTSAVFVTNQSTN